ncbi:hypothetical protein [Inconstantimicrobium mannanitabidum]|uniref:Uncharacterized protein n=1 Tax=Inconstantimicrobium mannanitabidum TaxID=1604901 RepID=A0ACB5RBI5_9CLOT|nr:hypothetical protein [Clostridium sp. TW13]GKX66490.1 hypothetical protein rsdtw13_17480 [Clostridium sp. TW13]
MRKKRSIILSISVFSIILVIGVTSYYFHYKNEKKYNLLLSDAQRMEDTGEFEKAKQLYNDSLKMKNSENVISKLNNINTSEKNLIGLKNLDSLISDKKYNDALNFLDSIVDNSKYVIDKVTIKKQEITKLKSDYEEQVKKEQEEQLKKQKQEEENKKKLELAKQEEQKKTKPNTQQATVTQSKPRLNLNIPHHPPINKDYIPWEKAVYISVEDFLNKHPNLTQKDISFYDQFGGDTTIDGSYYIQIRDASTKTILANYEIDPTLGGGIVSVTKPH